jgi:hypothetical protein
VVTAETLKKGLIRCFPEGVKDAKGKPVNAEVSAVVYDGTELIMASDKPVPGEGLSSVFAMDYDAEAGPLDQTIRYIVTPAIRAATKYEDFALTPDGRHVIATTGFDRVAEDSEHLDTYNSLVLWPRAQPDQAHVVFGRERGKVLSSVALRQHLTEVIGTPYYKIEGLAAVPGDGGDDLLLFGVRERGAHHAEFDYCSEIVAVPHRIEAGELVFTGDFHSAFSFAPHDVEGVRHTCGLSSLEYDPYSRKLYLLTSYETEDAEGELEIGGYLWISSLEDLHAGKRPHLVTHGDGRPVEFANKAEGLAVVSPERLLVVFDNDRHLGLEADRGRTQRSPNEAPYTLMAVIHHTA